jgi:hypothetical protein
VIKPTGEMKVAFEAAYAAAEPTDGMHFKEDAAIQFDAGLAAVLAIVERDLRNQLADALEEHAIKLRGEPFRGGAVGIEFINGVEEAAYRVRSGDLP